jgi:hypothetical protein
MESNVFILPRSVDTLNSGRIKVNKSASAVLQNFYSTMAPADSSITIDNQTGLLNGTLWSKQYSDNLPTTLHIYDTSFTRSGILKTDVNTYAYATSLVASNVFQSGELIRCYNEDTLYMVTNNGTSLTSVGVGTQTVQIANNTIFLNGNAYSSFLKTEYNSTVTGNIQINGLSIGSSTIAPSNANTVVTVGAKTITFSNSNSVYSFMSVGGTLSSNAYVETRIAASGTSVNLDLSKASKFVVNATSNITISMSNAAPNNNVAIVSILYHNTGYFYLNWPTTVKWPNGAEPFPPIAGNVGSYTLITTSNGNTWYGILTSNRY